MKPSPPTPLFFISHGAPTFALEPGQLGARLAECTHLLSGVKAIAMISAHWETPQQVCVATVAQPETIHDFYGFPAELYALRYPAPGATAAARLALTLLSTKQWNVAEDTARGLDHGAWVPLLHLLPEANIPVFQISLLRSMGATQAFKLGQDLAELLHQGIAIIGSGSLTHNLYEIQMHSEEVATYVRDFVTWVDEKLQARDFAALTDYRAQAPCASRAHPTEEHLLPLLVAAGASHHADQLKLLTDEVYYGVLSMQSYLWTSH